MAIAYFGVHTYSHSGLDQYQLLFPKNGSGTEEVLRLVNGAKMQVSRAALATMGHRCRMEREPLVANPLAFVELHLFDGHFVLLLLWTQLIDIIMSSSQRFMARNSRVVGV